jgi:hypothetical protein
MKENISLGMSVASDICPSTEFRCGSWQAHLLLTRRRVSRPSI